MDYQYKLIVTNRTIYKEFEIPADMEKVKLGTTSSCEFRLNQDDFFAEIEIGLEKKARWNVLCNNDLYISKGDVRKLLYSELNHGDVLNICYFDSGEVALELRFLIDFGADSIDYSLRINMDQFTSVYGAGSGLSIGDYSGAHIQLSSEYSQNTRVYLTRTADGLAVTEYSSLYGIYVNGKRIHQQAILHEYDFISIADFSACYKGGYLYFSSQNICLREIESLVSWADISPEYPLFVRNTRVKSKYEDTPIQILDPAAIPTEPEINWVTSLMPSLVMFVLIVVLRGILSTTGGTFVIFSICSMGLGVVTSVISILDKKKKYRLDCEKRRNTYLAYIENKKTEIEKARAEEVQCLQSQYYSIEQDLEHIETFSPCLFDRVPEDEDFLDVYLGTGTTEAQRKIDYKQKETLEVGDDLCQIPGELSESYRYLLNAPIAVPLREANAVGVVGESHQLYEMMKIMLTDIISRQYSGDVTIYMLLDEDPKKYDWLRLLPHIQGVSRQRNIVCDNESKNNIFENLFKELNERSNRKHQPAGFNIVFVMKERGIKSHPISRFIENASALNTVFIFFEPDMSLLPLHCSKIIRIYDNNQGVLFDAENQVQNKPFVYTGVTDERLRNAVNILAPVFCEEISLESSLRKSISLFELLGIYGVNDLNLTDRWGKSRIYDSMAVPLGVNAKDDIVYLDLHEKYHGPHGLVAGTTGSGKSEILQTFILGAATLFHPYEIGFVIIDFKGGGMVNQFKHLPHLIGAITNIDGKAIDRSLKSIKAELLKRQTLFAEAGVNHIDKYIKAYKENKVKTALPHLVMIVDEFAELKAEQPEFMKELISTARIGRSLGVHLILATQKPAGQVNEQIWSNSKFKLCMKVQTQADSNEVLRSPLAAEIREPGRAYLQVGNNELFELLQSGFSGSPEKSDSRQLKSYDIFSMDFKGNRKLIFRQRPQKTSSSRTQLEAIVDYVHDYCQRQRISPLPQICLPALPECIICNTARYPQEKSAELKTIIGIYDDPEHQYQGPVTLALGTANTLIIGSSQFGKTNLLETLLRNMAENCSPREVNVYIIDFASMVLKNFEKLAHVGGVVCPSDDEKLKNLFKYLSDQIHFRREKMLSVGVSSFLSYREAGYDDLPQIILFIDNMTALRELYLQDNDVLLNICREGVSVGISIVMANAQTTGLGYKYLANFASRVALFCTEVGEYANLFGACRLRPDETPGRCLVEIDKAFYECQTFLAFEGEKELERVRRMQEFIETTNAQYQGMRAIPIPEIPEILAEQDFLCNYRSFSDFDKKLIGLSYDTVMPVTADVMKNNMLAICGADHFGKSNFIRYFVHAFADGVFPVDLYVFDNYRKKLAPLADCGRNVQYEINVDSCTETMIRLEKLLQESYQALVSGTPTEPCWKLLIINNEDAITKISSDKAALAALKNIIGKYKMLNVYVILGSVPNAPIAYGAPEVYKLVKDTRSILFFDNLDNCKLVDIPLAMVRQNKKKLTLGDAFFISGNDCSKVKTPLAAN